MRLLTALKRQPADNCVILTYNVDLLFFEHLVFQPLYASGCRNTLVLCDPLQYGIALDDVEQLRYAGQRYLFMAARTSLSGAFHPKLVLLTSSDAGQLFLMSGNLTKAGYTRNWEVVSLFEYRAKNPDPTAWMACKWALEVLSRIVAASESDGLASQRLDQLLGTTAWLREEPPLPPSAPVWLLHNLDSPLLDQIVGHYRQNDGSTVRDVAIVSPFFDSDAQAVRQLLAKCEPQAVDLYTEMDSHGLNLRTVTSILKDHDCRFRPYHVNLEGRRLHAKTLLLRTERGAWIATGSANMSRSALLCPAGTGNTEIVVLRFETNPSYFDDWLGRLVGSAGPLELPWDAKPSSVEPGDAPRDAGLTLLSAALEKNRLTLSMGERLPGDGTLILHVKDGKPREIVFDKWDQAADKIVTLRLAPRVLADLEGPTLVALHCTSVLGDLQSNLVLLHNLRMLRRFSRPLDRRDRPRVPEGMTPQSYEHCSQLLDMLLDLLANNTEQLRRHGGRIASEEEAQKRENEMVIEGDEYDPEEHFVSERIEVASSATGADLYTDFYDRLTYEELLRAALAAVDRPGTEPTESQKPSRALGGDPEAESEISSEWPTDVDSRPEPPVPPDGQSRDRTMTRIRRGFRRLVDNFVKGSSDDEYLSDAPPRYLMELFVIITTYLRVVWRDGMLDEGAFLDDSLDMLTAFWGRASHPGVWQAVRPGLTDGDSRTEDERLALGVQTWLHAYVAADLLERQGDRRVYDLAAWIRHFCSLSFAPEALAALPDGVYRRLWRFSLPAAAEFHPVGDVIDRICNIREYYDDTSLLAEISAWPGVRAHTSLANTGELKDVPALEVTMPLSDTDLDRCLRIFGLFLLWPQPRQAAWARFTNSNPPTDAGDLESVRMFYRGDRQSLVLAGWRASEEYHPDVEITGVSAHDVGKLRSIEELCVLKLES